MKKILFIIGVFASLSSFACSCEYAGSFLKMAPATPLVSLVQVSKILYFKDINGQPTPLSMEVKIIDIYKGKEERSTITVWGDPGHLCRPYLSLFKEGEYYVIAFSKASNALHEKDTDYAISNCGAYWLTVDKKRLTASGDIDSDNRKSSTMALSVLKAKFSLNGR